MDKSVLVTGGCGFIGSHICRALLNKGHNVTCVDNLSQGNRENIADLGKKIDFVKADVNDFQEIKRVFNSRQFDFIFHYAATVGVKRTLQNPLKVLQDLEGTKNILELAKDGGVKKIVFSSSSEVYGNPLETPQREAGAVNAKLPYAIVKLASESFFQSYFEEFGLNNCCLRFFNVYGPRQIDSAYGFVVPIFINQVLRNRAPPIFGDGSNTRDFIYVDDVVKASILVVENKRIKNGVINIGRGMPVSILSLAEKIIGLCGKNLKPKFLPARENEIMHRFPDITKMGKLLGFKPRYCLEDGLIKTIKCYKRKNIFK